jgi:hypothetical protein
MKKFTLTAANGKSLELRIEPHWLTKQGFKIADNCRAVVFYDPETGAPQGQMLLEKQFKKALDRLMEGE